MRNKQRQLFTYTILLLVIIGLMSKLWANPSRLLLPVVIIGGIILLAKFPLRIRKRRNQDRIKYKAALRAQQAKQKKLRSFHVIDGKKKPH